MYDVIIVGAGAAGLTAAIYTARKQLSTLIIDPGFTGGQTSLTSGIENYPGVKHLPGPELMKTMLEQAKGFGAKDLIGKAIKIEPNSDAQKFKKPQKDENSPYNQTYKPKGSAFKVHLEDGSTHESKAVILTFGVLPRPLNIAGEKKFFGRGVSTCATCDAPFFKKKVVAVVGGGNAGVEAAIDLSVVAQKVYMIHRRDTFRADEVTVEKMKKIPNVELVLDSSPVEIKGDKVVTGVTVKNLKTNKTSDIEINGFFIEIGHIIDSSMVKGTVKMNEREEILVDEVQRTSYPGLFAAGDSTPVAYKQTVIAAGQGAVAALECYKYLTSAKGDAKDWAPSLNR